jgi:hypothetical protein
LKPALGKQFETLPQKYPTQNRAGVVQAVENLPSKHKALSSSPIPQKNKSTHKIHTLKSFWRNSKETLLTSKPPFPNKSLSPVNSLVV